MPRTGPYGRLRGRARLIVDVIVFLVVGGAIGFVGGIFGVGGAVMAVPVLGIFFAMSEQLAQGTALVMVFSNVVIALWQYNREQRLDGKLAVLLSVSALPFTYLAAHIATHVSSISLRIAFGSFAVCIALFMIYRLVGKMPAPRQLLPTPFVTVIGAISGLTSGAFGIGGAMFTIPAMSVAFGMTQVAAQGMALALAVPSALIGMATYALAHDVDWPAGIALAVGGLVTVGWGAHVAHRLPDRSLRWLWICFLFASAGALFARAGSGG